MLKKSVIANFTHTVTQLTMSTRIYYIISKRFLGGILIVFIIKINILCNPSMDTEDGPLNQVLTEQRLLEQAEPTQRPTEPDLMARTAAYLARSPSNIMEAIQANFADQLTSYNAVKSQAVQALMAVDHSSGKEFKIDIGDFISMADGRMAATCLGSNYRDRSNVNASFCLVNKTCLCCQTSHPVLLRGDGPSGRAAERRVLWLADQCAPAALPSLDESACIAMYRREYSNLREVADDFIGRIEGYVLPQGSIIIISSATQLATSGIFQYILDLKSIVRWFRNNLEAEVIPGPPLLLAGAASPQLIRGMIELNRWMTAASGSASILVPGFSLAIEAALESGTGSQAANLNLHILPKDLSSDYKSAWAFNHESGLPEAVGRLASNKEEMILSAFSTKLDEKFGITIGKLNHDRKILQVTNNQPAALSSKILVVGCSNAKRLGAELIEKGAAIATISAAGWRPTSVGVQTLSRLVREQVEAEKPDFVVFQLLDNVLYLAQAEDGTTTQPTRGDDGRFHIEGELILASKDVQIRIYRALKPVLSAVGDIPIVIITPLPRYAVAPCCDAASHITNYREPDYLERLLSDLREVRSNFRSCLFSDKVRRASLVDPTPVAAGRLNSEDWEDPVHPGKGILGSLADVVLNSVKYLDGKRKREEDDSREGGEGSSRELIPWSRSSGNQPRWNGPSGIRSARGRGGRGGGRGWRGRRESFIY